ncbi:MAG: SH3 domain-containing protein [Anaerolineales bacterium]|nr:MAG: SH3 domain-containing protein [Anaerolineales bacterium]
MKFFAWLMFLGSALILFSSTSIAGAAPHAQEATVTGTPEGPSILVPEQVNVRTGPSTDYEKVGVLIAGQRAPALGRSPGGEWIQIFYPGVPGNLAWVYAPFVVLDADQRLLPIIEPPPTPTPRVTATIDPTLAAQFNIGGAPPTRLPTFTPAEPVVQPVFDETQTELSGGFPPILAILGLLVVGLFGTVISVLRGG